MSKLREFFAPVDMTEGSPVKRILSFAIPMLVGNIAQQLYSTVDSIVVGKYVGDNALAAVGAAMPILNLLFVLFFGVSSGVSVVVAQYVGARNREKLSQSIGAGLLLSVLVAVLMMIIGPIVSGPMLRILDTPESIYGWAKSYLTILFVGYIGSVFYYMICGILRGMGDSFSALVYLLVACGMNIVLDLLFVAVIKMDGVNGVALATILAQFISAVCCFIKLSKLKEFFDLKWKYIRFHKSITTDILKLGIPTGATQMIMSLCMVVVQSLTNTFGETFIAANVICMRVDSFAMMPNMTFSVAMTTYVGQNLGAGRYDRIHDGIRKGLILALEVSAVMIGLLLIFSGPLITLFTETAELIALCKAIIRTLALGYLAMAVTQCLQGSMRGAGNTVSPMWISIVTSILVRVPLAYLIRNLTITAERPEGSHWCIFVSMLITWVLGAVITVVVFLKGKWRKTIDKPMEQQS